MSEREFLLQLSEGEVEALVEVMFLAAEADGEVESVELSQLAETIERVTNGSLAKPKALQLAEQARVALAASDRPTRLAALRLALPAAKRAHALLLAIQVTSSDGVMRTSERDLILELSEALEIDGETAANLVRAVSSPAT
jgi:tellurite resistance protein